MTRKLKLIILGVIIAGVFAGINLLGFQGGIKNFFYSVTQSFQKTLWGAGERASNFWAGILEAENLKKENNNLSLQINQLVQEKLALNALKSDNDTLRQVLNLGLEKEFKLKLAVVINKDVFHDSLTINQGSEDGISSGMPVITAQKVLVGKIGEVYKNFSKVILISDKESSFDAQVSGKDATGLVRGEGSGNLTLELVPRDKLVAKGDSVATGALGGVFPADLLVGQIESVSATDVNPFQQIIISPVFNLDQLDNLFIITKF